MVKVLFNAIFDFFGKIIDALLGFIDFPVVPLGLVSRTNTLFSYMSQGMAIVNFVCPINQIKPRLVLFVGVWAAKHLYEVVMWVLRKIPFFGVS